MKHKLLRATAGTVLMLLLFLLASCGAQTKEPRALVEEFCRVYGMEARVFYTAASPDSEEYLNEETVQTVFCSQLPVGVELAVAMHSKLGSVREVGVFTARSSSDRYLVIALVRERLDYLSSAASSGEPFVVLRGNTVTYGFVENGEIAEQIMKGLL